MSTPTCDSIGYLWPNDFCLIVTVDKEIDDFDVDAAWIAGATFLGLFLGAGIVLLCAKPCIESWEKKKRQDEERLLEKGVSSHHDAVDAKAVKGWVSKDDENIQSLSHTKEKKGFFKGIKFFGKKIPGKTKEASTDVSQHEEQEVDRKTGRGLIDIVIQNNSASAEVEMADQDMTELILMEREQNQARDVIMVRILALLLKKKMEKRAVTTDFYYTFVRKTEEEMRDLSVILIKEKENDEKKLRSDKSLAKDPHELESELDKLHSQYSNKTAKMHKDYRNEIRVNLLRSSGLSESEVEEVMERLINNMAVVEENIGLEQARQRRALEQRLAKRRQALEFNEYGEKEIEEGVTERVDLFRNILEGLTKESAQLERQNDEIVTDFSNDLNLIRDFHRKEYNTNLLEKYKDMKKNRENAQEKLNKKQEKEKATLLHMSEKSTAEDFIKLYHDLLVKHHMEKEVLNSDMDQKEVQEIHKLKQEMSKEEKKKMEAAGEEMVEKLETKTDLSHQEAARLVKLHKQHVAQAAARRQKERQAMLARLEERLHQRLQAADEAEARDQAEQEKQKEEQMSTMSKVLATNMDLTEEAKERVMREHEQNMQALSNQLTRSKLRQQKSLEIKLNQRKARLAELQKKKEEQVKSMKDEGEMKDDKMMILTAQIAKEEEEFEAARKAAVADLRRRLAEETNEALKEQDEEISLLIGRLQVGQARRKAKLERQDATLKHLQEELERKVSGGDAMPTSVTEQILAQHYNQVNHLNQQIQRRRDNQQQLILEKLTRKKTMLETEIETQLEEDAQTEYSDRRARGAGYATLALMQTFLEQRHSQAMAELQEEMSAELEKSKTDLNQQMELQLKKELEIQRQNLLTQLAAVKGVSTSELKEAVSAATQGSSDNKATLRMVKDLKNEMQRAKSSMDYSDSREDSGYQRSGVESRHQGLSRDVRRGSVTAARRESRVAFDQDARF